MAIVGLGIFYQHNHSLSRHVIHQLLAHLLGRRRYETGDNSRNSLFLALITLGEGWHNNHHRYMSATRQGFYWWEIDISYYLLRVLSWTGIIWNLKPVPLAAYENNHRVLSPSKNFCHPSSSRMKRLAIIGTGIAGLGCAHFLHRRFALTLYENDYVGGHSNTVSVPDENRSVPIDTGFMVFNEVTYPNLTRLFRELGVAVKPAPMSFSVQHLPTRLEFCGSSLNHLFGRRKNLFRPRFWKMILQINRFNTERRWPP